MCELDEEREVEITNQLNRITVGCGTVSLKSKRFGNSVVTLAKMIGVVCPNVLGLVLYALER